MKALSAVDRTLAMQYFRICPSVISLKILCDNKCEAEFTNTGHYTVWIFEDDSTLRLDWNRNVTVNGRMMS